MSSGTITARNGLRGATAFDGYVPNEGRKYTERWCWWQIGAQVIWWLNTHLGGAMRVVEYLCRTQDGRCIVARVGQRVISGLRSNGRGHNHEVSTN